MKIPYSILIINHTFKTLLKNHYIQAIDISSTNLSLLYNTTLNTDHIFFNPLPWVSYSRGLHKILTINHIFLISINIASTHRTYLVIAGILILYHNKQYIVISRVHKNGIELYIINNRTLSLQKPSNAEFPHSSYVILCQKELLLALSQTSLHIAPTVHVKQSTLILSTPFFFLSSGAVTLTLLGDLDPLSALFP